MTAGPASQLWRTAASRGHSELLTAADPFPDFERLRELNRPGFLGGSRGAVGFRAAGAVCDGVRQDDRGPNRQIELGSSVLPGNR